MNCPVPRWPELTVPRQEVGSVLALACDITIAAESAFRRYLRARWASSRIWGRRGIYLFARVERGP